MNSILDEMLSFIELGESSIDILEHYGMPRRSGRYPWGSGDNPYQHTGDFMSRVDQLRKENFTYTDEKGKTWTGDNAIAKSMNLSSTEFRTLYSLGKDERRKLEVARAKSLREDGYSLAEIAEKMGYANDSSVRSLLNSGSEARMNQARVTADFIKKQIDEKGMIDVGVGVERELGISKEKLNQALYILELEGYPVYGAGVPQATNPGKQTNIRVICPPGTEHKDIYNYQDINSLRDYISYDGGESFTKSFHYPSSLDSKRLDICYAEDGGINKDGIVELRRGVPDLSLGESNYAQVRILVDGTHYIKGMAVYSDDLPPGIDVRFNTNKSSNVPKMEVLKEIKKDPNNPFGSLIKEHGGQSFYDDPNGKFTDPVTGHKQSLSLINKRAEEGDWGNWSDHLSPQFLSKQSEQLVKKQLNLTIADKKAEFDEICSLNNPTIKKVLLKSFADDCDAAAVHLKAAALPRQKYQVILPLTSVKDTEVYAPNYKDGETVALIRYPHGGTFEIPVLKVNNKLKEGKDVIGVTPKDAIGISKNVADKLSGADFDGDTVMVIPTGDKNKIISRPTLRGLKGFDPKMEYGCDEKKTDSKGETHYFRDGKEYKIMKNTQTEMGIVSNLITDMTLKGANDDELAAAVRHSMVVIDAEKHKLDYKQSYEDNHIAYLKKRYQGHYDENDNYREGVSTLISRAKSPKEVLKRKGQPWINPETGEIQWERTNPKTGEHESKYVYEEYVDKNGKTKVRTQESTKMAETNDAFTLISEANTPIERAYAQYANEQKALANAARKEMISTGSLKYNPQSKETYAKEVKDLDAKLNVALMNAPRERQAQMMAAARVKAKKQEFPDMTKSEIKKERQLAITEARKKVGAARNSIEITDREWEAIQSGAISENKLLQILNNTNTDDLKMRATPRNTLELSQAKINKINAMKNSGYTTSEIAEALGVSASTVSKNLK